MRGLLEPTRLLIDTVTSGPEAIKKVKKMKYDIIFLDQRMPGMDGIQTLQAMKALPGPGMDIEGEGIQSYSCVKCGTNEGLAYFDARSGGLLCEDCAKDQKVTYKVSPALIYTLQYIQSTPFNRLYNFNLKDEVFTELKRVADRFRDEYVDKKFKSLEILAGLA